MVIVFDVNSNENTEDVVICACILELSILTQTDLTNLTPEYWPWLTALVKFPEKG